MGLSGIQSNILIMKLIHKHTYGVILYVTAYSNIQTALHKRCVHITSTFGGESTGNNGSVTRALGVFYVSPIKLLNKRSRHAAELTQ